jgi:hypothetical protein
LPESPKDVSVRTALTLAVKNGYNKAVPPFAIRKTERSVIFFEIFVKHAEFFVGSPIWGKEESPKLVYQNKFLSDEQQFSTKSHHKVHPDSLRSEK